MSKRLRSITGWWKKRTGVSVLFRCPVLPHTFFSRVFCCCFFVGEHAVVHAVVLAIQQKACTTPCPAQKQQVRNSCVQSGTAGMRCVLWIGENGLGGREKACGVWGGWLLQVLGCMRLGWVGDSDNVGLSAEVAPVDYH